MIKKRCEYCGREFETRASRKKYCNYAHFVLDRPEQFLKPEIAISRHKARSLPSLEYMKEQYRKMQEERKK